MLVLRIRDGDSAAFTELYQATYRSVYYHAQTILKNEEDVEDAVQEAYEQAYINLDRLNSPEAIGGWLNQTVSNISLNKVRSQKGKNNYSLDDEDFHYDAVAPDSETPDIVLEQKSTEEIIRNIISALPEVQRKTVSLFYFSQMSVADIARIMECSTGTVKSRLNYARRNIEKAVREEEKHGIKLYSVSLSLLLNSIRKQIGTEPDAESAQRVLQRISEKYGLDTAQAEIPAGSNQLDRFHSKSSRKTGGKASTPKNRGLKTRKATSSGGRAQPLSSSSTVTGAAAGAGGMGKIAMTVIALALGAGMFFQIMRPDGNSIDVEAPLSNEWGNNIVTVTAAPEEDDTQEPEERTAESEEDTGPVAGNIVRFGHYEQDNDLENGDEPIEWRILDVQDGRVLLISKDVLSCQAISSGIWENSASRSWLNDTFLKEAFTEEEQRTILTTEVDNSYNQQANRSENNVGNSGGNNTEDKIFLLSFAESNEYFDSDDDRIAWPSSYAISQELPVWVERNSASWWLRSPGRNNAYNSYVGPNGDNDREIASESSRFAGIRPAMWVAWNPDVIMQ